MRFRLMYHGELKASGNNNRSAEKWKIRHDMHLQLEELWNKHPILQGHSLAAMADTDESGVLRASKISDDEQRAANRARLRKLIHKGGQQFLPLVSKSLSLSCSLDILFLRKDEPGFLFKKEGGDLDNRLKTLLDGLSVPTDNELPHGSSSGIPHYCLLEDDKLITDLSIHTDRLLSRPDASQNEVSLVIDVSIKPSGFAEGNLEFLFYQKW